jgi:hypothetical protein
MLMSTTSASHAHRVSDQSSGSIFAQQVRFATDCPHSKIRHVFTQGMLSNEATSDSRCDPMINDLVVSFLFSSEEDEAAAALRLFMRHLVGSLEVWGDFVTARYIFGTFSTAIEKGPRIGRLCSETEAGVR